MTLSNVKFFGAVDRKNRRPDERICSEYPAWYFDVHIEDMKESISSKERALKLGLVHPTEIAFAESELKREKERMKEIESSVVKLNGKTKDEAYSLYKSLGEQITDSMFTRTDMMKGLADAHEEARRVSDPIIDVGEKGRVFENIGITPMGGKVTRNQAARMYKILGKVLGENTNTERLRKDHSYGIYKSDIPLSEMV